jgi:hypothetical protein
VVTQVLPWQHALAQQLLPWQHALAQQVFFGLSEIFVALVNLGVQKPQGIAQRICENAKRCASRCGAMLLRPTLLLSSGVRCVQLSQLVKARIEKLQRLAGLSAIFWIMSG